MHSISPNTFLMNLDTSLVIIAILVRNKSVVVTSSAAVLPAAQP
jgi:hypothetical protein